MLNNNFMGVSGLPPAPPPLAELMRHHTTKQQEALLPFNSIKPNMWSTAPPNTPPTNQKLF